MADQCCIPSRDSTGHFIRVHGNPPPAQRPSPIQLASNRLQPVAAMVQEAANESRIFTQRATHHQANPQQVGEPVEDDLEESETEGLVGTLEIIGPSLETFMQLPLPSAQPSIIPCPSPSQGQTPPQPSFSPPPPPPNSPPPATGPHNLQTTQKPPTTLNRLLQTNPPNHTPPILTPAPTTQTTTPHPHPTPHHHHCHPP